MIKKLNEDTSLKFKNISPEEKSKKGILGRLYGPVASFAAPTRNGRHYSQDLWEKLFNSDLIKERFANGGIFGELCHPDYEDVNMEKIAVVMPEPPVKDDKGDLIAYVDIVDTPCGRIAYQLAKYGYKFGISSRGTGDIIEDWNGNEEVDPDTYQLNAFDLVEIPAVESARLAFVESLDTKKKYGKTLKEKLTEEINSASESDKKIMTETLNNLDIKLDEKLVEPSEEDLARIENAFAELGLEIEGKGDTLFGNKHYQLRKELDHKVTKEDLGPIFDALCDLDTDDMPTVCNVGVHRDGDNIISASLDVLKKHVDDVDEELAQEDGWPDDIKYELEPIFNNVEDLMYEIRNCRRGSYDDFGDSLSGLISRLDRISNDLSDVAGHFERDEDKLNEDTSIQKFGDEDNEENYHNANWYIGGRNNFEVSTDDLGSDTRYTASRWSHNYKNTQEMEDDIKNLQSMIQIVNDLEAKGFKNGELRESVNAKLNIRDESIKEDCSDKEVVDESAGNSGNDLVNQLQEALLKNGELEKDNLSLQEKLSVCNAKEIKLNEELSRYKKAAASLSESTKNIKDLEEELERINRTLEYKDKLIESKNSRLEGLIKFKKENLTKVEESESKISGLEKQVKELNEKLDTSNKKLENVTNIAKKYQGALKESKERYISAKAEAYGISEDAVKAQLKESYSYKDIDSICDELSERKLNMSKLPFRLNENTQLNFKPSKNEYIKGGKLEDDEVSDYLLSILN